ncbi:SPOSA6832_03472, partial [Sporobolomyces salmonicolor]
MSIPQTTSDIQTARKAASFDPNVVNKVLNAGSRDAEVRQRIARIVAEEEGFDKRGRDYMSRPQQLERGLAVARRLFETVDKHDLDYMEYIEALFAVDEYSGLNLHEIAFTPVIQAQGSDEQQADWLPKCYNHEILGAYLQTELGHGSNVQQLETTSSYDPATHEFILHSPTVSATKWWIGALGIMATHGVVQARLQLDGKDMGPHLFLVQRESMSCFFSNRWAGLIARCQQSARRRTIASCPASLLARSVRKYTAQWVPSTTAVRRHSFKLLKLPPEAIIYARPLAGARFDKVRIPRSQMLARFAQVTAEGKYVRPPHDKLSYGGMIFIRAQMIGSLSWRLAKAATISLRYLHMRRQFADPELKAGEPGYGIERPVITYPGVYRRVIPVLARTIVFITAGKDMANLYHSMSSQLSSGSTTLLAETHAVSSGLKTYVSTSVVEGIETVRRAMGGHGFLAASGVGRIYASELPSATYEGDNYILHLQVARAALKSFHSFVTSPSTNSLSPFSAYLSTLRPPPCLPLAPPTSFLSPSFLIHLLSLRAALSISRLAGLGKKPSELSWESVETSKAVVEAFLARRMGEAMEDGGLLVDGAGEREREVMRKVVLFFLLHTVEEALPALLEFSILAPPAPRALLGASVSSSRAIPNWIDLLRLELDQLAQQLLPELVGLTDSFGFSDWELDTVVRLSFPLTLRLPERSCLILGRGGQAGNVDGGVYERMLDKAQADEQLNLGTVEHQQRLYKEYIRPILERGRRLSKL